MYSEIFRQVDRKVLELFEDAASDFIEEVGAKDALCMALAFISETHTKHLESKSLLTGEDGMVTYALRTSDKNMYSTSFVHQLLEQAFSSEICNEVKGVKLRGSKVAVFDLPELAASSIDKEYKETVISSRLPFTLERATQLPEMERDYGRSGGGGFRNNRG